MSRLAKIRPWISVGLALTVIGLGAWYVVRHFADFAILGRLGTVSLLAILATVFVYMLLGGHLLNLFLRRYDVALPWYRWLGLYATMSVGNMVTPVRGGTGIGAVYLKSVHGLTFSRFAMVLVGTYVGAAIVNAVLGLGGMGISYAATGWFNPTAVGGAAVVLVGGLATFFIPNLRPSERWGWTYAVRAINGWHQLVGDRRLLANVLAVQLAMNLVHVGTYVLIYRGLGLDMPVAAVVTIVSIGTIASMIALTPASLGPYDVVLVALPTTFGLTGPEAMAALLVMRAVHLAGTLALAGIFGFALRTPAGPPLSPPPPSAGV